MVQKLHNIALTTINSLDDTPNVVEAQHNV